MGFLRRSTSPSVPADGPPAARGSLRPLVRAIRYLSRYRRETALAYGALLLATGAQLMVPKLISGLIDSLTSGLAAMKLQALPPQAQAAAAAGMGLSPEALGALQADPTRGLLLTGGLILVFALIRGLFSFSQVYMGERASHGVSFDMRNDLFAKIQRLSFSYHDRNHTGQLMIRATDDVEKVRLFVGQGLLMAVQSLLLLTGTLLILSATNARLMLVILPILPIAVLLFMVIGAVARPMFEAVQTQLSALNAVLQENMAGIKVVKAFHRESQQIGRFDRAADHYLAEVLRVMRLMTMVMPTLFLIANLGQALILYFGGRQIIGGTLTLGEWQEFSLYLVFVFLPIGQLGFIVTQMSQASASAGRVFEIMDAANEVADSPQARPLPPVQGRVTFEEVTFRYAGGGRPVLNRVSFQAEPGQRIALLGMTGSGKSSIINLIPRFYDPTHGRVLIDGYDVRQITLDSLRSQIGIVLQETTLFSGTIRENIAFGRPDSSLDQVIDAAKAAAAHGFISQLPDGYQTHVGERGATLSGGERQRVAIARALLLNPRILILDDATSSVDLQTELEIQRALDRLMHSRTSFVIAQRMSTVVQADHILVLDQGQVVAQGRHAELMETSELYADIYSSQLAEDAAPEFETAVSAAGGEGI
ncbi:MAG: ABC transporter ATP-binding protein/permease [Anaerolineales bacterium]|nr:ABC transporter ATP-binding protein/permease [Anaerolineales bacterium]